MKYKNLITITLFVGIFMSYATKAHAYLDPGTGSFILQMALAAALGAAYTCKIYWHKIRLFFSNRSSKKNNNQSDEQ